MIDYNEYINDTIHVLNLAGVNIMDISEEELGLLGGQLERALNPKDVDQVALFPSVWISFTLGITSKLPSSPLTQEETNG